MRGNSSLHLARGPRRGQALLLAVLVMIFAALLGAAFIAVVSINLNQTAKQQDKSAATKAADAGLKYVDEQLTYSKEGDRWYKVHFDSPTLPDGTPNDEYVGAGAKETDPVYYSALDRAQGWTSYAKFPHPYGPDADGPKFLFRVEDMTTGDKQGAQKITVIGLSPNDPTAYSTAVAYKGGYMRAPLGRVMRAVSNTDPVTNLVPEGAVSAATTSSTSLVMKDIKGNLPAVPFYIMIGDPVSFATTAAAPRSVAVVAKTAVSGGTYTLTLGTAISTTADEKIQVAAALGQPEDPTKGRGVDFDHDGNLTDGGGGTTDEKSPTQFKVSQATTDGTTPTNGGVRVNGGLAFFGNNFAYNLNPLDAVTGIASTVFCSGAMTVDNSSNTTPPANDPAAATEITSGVVSAGTAAVSDSSAATDFPEAGGSGSWSTASTDQPLKLVSDGWNGMDKTSPAADRNISNFAPPSFTTGAGLERYRDLTLGSPSTVSGVPQASAYGNGEGIYVNNPDDKESVYDGSLATPAIREMTQEELYDLWNPKTGSASKFIRTNTEYYEPLTSTNLSLEELHQRGWVSPNEFIPRGATVELIESDPIKGTGPFIAITLDNIDDNTTGDTTRAQGPVKDKTWKNPSTGDDLEGVYRQVFNWPANGVLFAEGNIRIFGEVLDAPRSLTVVSQNNIYVEGSVTATSASVTNPAKLLLLAKKNVVVNPTQITATPTGATILTADVTAKASSTNVTVTVADATIFEAGDFVSIGSKIYGVVATTPTTATDLQIRVTAPIGTDATVAATDADNVVRNARTTIPTAVASGADFYNRIANNNQGFQRRVKLNRDADLTSLRLAIDHVGVRDNANPALLIEADDLSGTELKPSPLKAEVTHKQNQAILPGVDLNRGIITHNDKLVRVAYDPPGPGTDQFPASVPADDLAAYGIKLSDLETQIESVTHPITIGVGWKYDVTVPAAFANMPFYYLASFGNRAKEGTSVADYTSIGSTPSPDDPGELPVATSISVWANGSRRKISSDHYDTTNSAFYEAGQFGFAPLDGVNPTFGEEDSVTSDVTFYRVDAEFKHSLLDSRQFSGLIVGRQNSIALTQGMTEDGNGIPATDIASDDIAEYRLRNIKLENATFTAGELDELKPGTTIEISAYVYAQEGSWYVIPGDYFSNQIKIDTATSATYCDYNENGTPDQGEFVDSATPTATTAPTAITATCFADINHNGIQDPEEMPALYRYYRYNYGIKFLGAIMENQTALVNDAGAYKGGVKEWTEKWSTIQVDEAGTATPTITPAVVQYTFDPGYASGKYDPNGFVLPIAPGLAYQS